MQMTAQLSAGRGLHVALPYSNPGRQWRKRALSLLTHGYNRVGYSLRGFGSRANPGRLTGPRNRVDNRFQKKLIKPHKVESRNLHGSNLLILKNFT